MEDQSDLVNLPVADLPRKKEKTVEMFPISGAEVKGTSGKATKILWDSRIIWVPTSQIKTHNGAMAIPEWLAVNKGMKR